MPPNRNRFILPIFATVLLAALVMSILTVFKYSIVFLLHILGVALSLGSVAGLIALAIFFIER